MNRLKSHVNVHKRFDLFGMARNLIGGTLLQSYAKSFRKYFHLITSEMAVDSDKKGHFVSSTCDI